MKIRPDLLAGKIANCHFDRHAGDLPSIPAGRLKEALWFIQAMSMGKRSIPGLVDDLIAQYPARFISKAMHDAGALIEDRYSVAQCIQVWKAIWDKLPNHRRPSDSLRRDPGHETFEEWLVLHVDHHLTPKQLQSDAYDRPAIMQGAERFNWPFLKKRCEDAARADMEARLTDWCVEPDFGFRSPWYCPELPGLILAFMERHAEQTRAAIADTEITRLVFHELECALATNSPVPIIGQSRIGKSTPALAWCSMRPGRARLVTVPESNRMRDFIEACATAFGIDFTPGTSTASLTSQVKFVHQNSGLFVCYDEAQGLIPIRYDKNSPPPRLEFVRHQVIDRGLGCSFIATPQSYHQTLEQYVKTTGYKIEQWLGRITPAVVLPEDLGIDDMMAIARLHFPQLPEPHLKIIAAKAMLSEGYIKNMELAARYALCYAQQRGHATPTRTDIDDAITRIMGEPSAAPATRPAPSRAVTAEPLQPVRSAGAERPRQPISDSSGRLNAPLIEAAD